MPRDSLARPLHEVRRADRAVEDEAWIADLLARAPVGALATVHDGQPFQNINLFAYDGESKAIFLHTARYGRTQANVDADERVCFSVAEMGRLLPADEALEFSVEYASVTVFGRARLVTDAEEGKRGLQLILDKYAPHLRPGVDYRPTTDAELARTAVFKVEIDSWSGKRKVVAEDFPGAYFYGEPPV